MGLWSGRDWPWAEHEFDDMAGCDCTQLPHAGEEGILHKCNKNHKTEKGKKFTNVLSQPETYLVPDVHTA